MAVTIPDGWQQQTFAIRRIRRTPTITEQKHWTFYHRLRLDMEMGVGLQEPQQGDDPMLMLRWSDDGGHTWSSEHWAGAGKMGQYRRRAIWNRLGRARQRTFELEITDPVRVVLIAAELDMEQGLS